MIMRALTYLKILTSLLVLTGVQACSPQARTPDAANTPDPLTASTDLPGLITAASPDAVKAGREILQAGGSAVDAAIAIQASLSLVEPQSSGIGGGAFMVYYQAATGKITVYDGRESAPSAATPELFIDENGEVLGFMQAWRSGLSTGVPGAIAMLALAHENHGTLSWADSFAPAIYQARNGFEVQPRLSMSAARMAQFTDMEEYGAAAKYLYDENGEAWPVGHRLTNEAYAQTLESIAENWRNFYTGDIAEAIVNTVSQPPRPGLLSLDDLIDYKAKRRDPVCAPYRDLTVCSAPPPASGGVAINAILGILDNFDMSRYGPTSLEGWHLFIEASRLAYADRDHYVGDSDFVDVPVEGLIDRAYLKARSELITPGTAQKTVQYGVPFGAPDHPRDTSDDQPGTSHFVVVDKAGNVVSMTTTVESVFGSGRMVKGFFLNNQLTDFARDPYDETGRLRPNAPAAGKRPRSSMSPTIVLDERGDFKLATGSPGGNSIIGYTAKSLIAMIDWKMSPDEAASLTNIVARGDTIRIEAGFEDTLLAGLGASGFTLDANRGEISGLHIAMMTDDGELIGAADPRRDGLVSIP